MSSKAVPAGCRRPGRLPRGRRCSRRTRRSSAGGSRWRSSSEGTRSSCPCAEDYRQVGSADARIRGERARRDPARSYNPGPPARPRQAASVILLRGGAETLELLLVRRTPKARFMGGVWVFPGGAVDAEEGDGDEAHRPAAIRELREEAAIALEDPDAARQVLALDHARPRCRSASTPTSSSPRCPRGQEPRIDGEECVDLGWFTPAARARRPRAPARSLLGLPDDQAPRAAERLRLGRELLALRARSARCSRSSRGWCSRARSRASCCRATRLLSRRTDQPARALACVPSITWVTALISARCVNAWG